jgi:hypothetical protein
MTAKRKTGAGETFCLYCEPTVLGHHEKGCPLWRPATEEEVMEDYANIVAEVGKMAGMDPEAVRKAMSQEDIEEARKLFGLDCEEA